MEGSTQGLIWDIILEFTKGGTEKNYEKSQDRIVSLQASIQTLRNSALWSTLMFGKRALCYSDWRWYGCPQVMIITVNDTVATSLLPITIMTHTNKHYKCHIIFHRCLSLWFQSDVCQSYSIKIMSLLGWSIKHPHSKRELHTGEWILDHTGQSDWLFVFEAQSHLEKIRVWSSRGVSTPTDFM